MKKTLIIILGSIAIIAVVLFAFRYLNEGRFSQIPILSNVFSKNTENSSSNNADYGIVAVSNVGGVDIALKDTNGIISFIKDMGIYDRNFVESSEAKGNTGGQPIKTVYLVLAPDIQPKNRFSYPDGAVYASSFAEYKSGGVDVYVQIDSKILESEQNEQIADRIEGQFMLTLYNLTHPVSDLTEYNERMQKAFSEVRERKLDFLSVSK